MRPSWFLFACALRIGTSSADAELARPDAPKDDGTRMARVMNAPTLAAFEQGFAQLSESEQVELVRLLTTEMRGWDGLQKLPAQAGEIVMPERKRSFESLLAWLQEAPDAQQSLSELRFVGLLEKPQVKLKFEKGECLRDPPPPLDWADRMYLKTIAWLARAARRPAWFAPSPRVPGPCHREIQVGLAADPGRGLSLREQDLIRIDVEKLPSYLQGPNWPQFRRKVWEGLEILLSDLGGETRLLPQRLRVIEVSGTLTREAFLERRQAAILLRSHHASTQAPTVQGR